MLRRWRSVISSGLDHARRVAGARGGDGVVVGARPWRCAGAPRVRDRRPPSAPPSRGAGAGRRAAPSRALRPRLRTGPSDYSRRPPHGEGKVFPILVDALPATSDARLSAQRAHAARASVAIARSLSERELPVDAGVGARAARCLACGLRRSSRTEYLAPTSSHDPTLDRPSPDPGAQRARAPRGGARCRARRAGRPASSTGAAAATSCCSASTATGSPSSSSPTRQRRRAPAGALDPDRAAARRSRRALALFDAVRRRVSAPIRPRRRGCARASPRGRRARARRRSSERAARELRRRHASAAGSPTSSCPSAAARARPARWPTCRCGSRGEPGHAAAACWCATCTGSAAPPRGALAHVPCTRETAAPRDRSSARRRRAQPPAGAGAARSGSRTSSGCRRAEARRLAGWIEGGRAGRLRARAAGPLDRDLRRGRRRPSARAAAPGARRHRDPHPAAARAAAAHRAPRRRHRARLVRARAACGRAASARTRSR